MAKSNTLSLLALLGASTWALACGRTGGIERPVEQARLSARPIYLEQCAPCHGARADGNGPNRATLEPKPRDYTDLTWRASATPDRIFTAIHDGVEGSAMPGWGRYLSEQEIWDLTSYVLSVAEMGP